MRTVTFADAALIKKLNTQVHAVWNNQNPDGDGGANDGGEAAAQAVPEGAAAAYPCGGGGGNIRAFFCTPDGEVIHYIQGYWPAKDFTQELEIALKIFESTKTMDKETRRQKVVDGLQVLIEAMEKQRREMAENNPQEFAKAISESAVQREHAAIGLRASAYSESINFTGRDMAEVLAEMLRQNVRRGAII